MARVAPLLAAAALRAGTAGAALPPYPKTRPCDKEPLKSAPTCDPSVGLEERVADLVARVPADSVVGLLSTSLTGGSAAVESLNIPEYQWWSEALHGVLKSCFTDGGVKKCPTSFPAGITTSCAFNNSLVHAIGTAIGTEARVFNNVGKGTSVEPVQTGSGLTFWTPNVNIFRDPRWGRGQETPGEDPTVNADYAENFVSGFQSGEDPSHLKVSACCKHYAAYSLEKFGGKTRHNFNAVIPQQDLEDTYLPAFQSCVSRGNASGVMCSYNAVNGVPSCASEELLNTNLRERWGFNGYITSDCGAVADVYNGAIGAPGHRYNATPDATVATVLRAGMDTDCGSVGGSFFTKHLPKALSDGSVTDAAVRGALANLFRVQMRVGMFDPDGAQPYRAYGADRVDTPAHRALALEAARQGLVLVKNDGALPLSRAPALATVAVVGPNGDATTTLQSNYHGAAPYLISPIDGVRQYAPNATFTAGCTISGADASGVAAAAAAAAAADVTVVVLGLDPVGTAIIDPGEEGEGKDRTSVALPGAQSQLLAAVSAQAKGKVVVVVISGGAVDISAAKADPKVGAILIAGYPGQSGGRAIADALFGEYNPGGRLTQTWYPANFTSWCSMFEMSMRPSAACPSGRSYRFFTPVGGEDAVYRFGDGLSYTTFVHRDVTPPGARRVAAARVRADLTAHRHAPHAAPALTTVRVAVANTGAVAGGTVVLVYVRGPRAGEGGRPLRALRRYERVHLAPGAEEELAFPLTAHDLGVVTPQGDLAAEEGAWSVEVNNDAAPSIAITVA